VKRIALLFAMFALALAATAVTTPNAQAGLFGGKKSTPTPSPSASALPTASPEPPEVAIPRLQAKLKANPNDQQSMTELAGEFLQINRADMAVQLTQHLLQMGDKTAQVYYLDGFAMEQLGRMDVATQDLQQAEDLDPSNIGILSQLADLYVRQGRLSEAERIGNRAVVLNEKDPTAYVTLGSVYAAQKKYDQARGQFEKAFAMDPKDTRPLYEIAITYADQNNTPMALQSIQRALTVDPKDVQSLVFKADQYAKQHDDTRAGEAYDDAIVAATDPHQKAAIIARKAAYFTSEKKFAQAQAVFDQGIAQLPQSADLHVAYGDFWLNQKNTGKAQAEFKAALAIDKDNSEALLRLAQLAMRQNRMSDAVDYLKRLTQVTPDPQAFAMLGQAYSFLHDYQNSKEACVKSFQMQKEAATLGCIAGADFELKNYKEASQIFDALDQNAHGFLEQNPELLWVAGKSYTQTHQKQKAIDAYKRLLAMMPKGTKDYNQIQQQIADLNKSKP
jgi:tetratricopeptide (TPR) repeat protein